MEEIGIALIGCGGMMGAHADRGFRQLWEKGFRSFRIVACVDEREESAQRLADNIEKWQGKRPSVYRDTSSLLVQEKSVQGVDISVPHHVHHTIALTCLSEGKDVLIEKPLAITLRAGRQMIEEAERRGVILSVAENYRREWSQRAINWALRRGMIGEPKKIYWLDIYERRRPWGWRDLKEFGGGGWLLDGGVHFADLMRYHLGEVDSVFGVIAVQEPRRFSEGASEPDLIASIEDVAHALLDFASGFRGSGRR